MASDAELIDQLRRALGRASAAAKRASEQLDAGGVLYAATRPDSTAHATLMPCVKRALAEYESLSVQALRFRDLLNKQDA